MKYSLAFLFKTRVLSQPFLEPVALLLSLPDLRLLLRPLFFIFRPLVRDVGVIRVVHLGVAATGAAAALVRRIKFLCNIRVGICAEVFVNGLLIFIRGATVWPSALLVT